MKFKLVSEFNKLYDEQKINEIYEGVLFSETGFMFPIIKGIPRILIESVYDYAAFLKDHLYDYEERKKKLEKDFPGILHYCYKKNKRTKKSFEFEWSFLNTEKEIKSGMMI